MPSSSSPVVQATKKVLLRVSLAISGLAFSTWLAVYHPGFLAASMLGLSIAYWPIGAFLVVAFHMALSVLWAMKLTEISFSNTAISERTVKMAVWSIPYFVYITLLVLFPSESSALG